MRQAIDELLPDSLWKASTFLLDRGKLDSETARYAARLLWEKVTPEAGRLGRAIYRAAYWYLVSHAKSMEKAGTLEVVYATMLAQEHVEKAQAIRKGQTQ